MLTNLIIGIVLGYVLGVVVFLAALIVLNKQK